MTSLLDKTFGLLVNDNNFMTRVEESIRKIMNDNKITFSDIPEVIHVIVDSYNTMSKFHLDKNNLPDLVKMIVNYIVSKHDLVPSDMREELNKYIDSSMKLVLLNPTVSKSLFKCLCCK